MKEYIYHIDKKREKSITDILVESGITSFYIEYSGGITVLKIYSDSDISIKSIEGKNLISVNKVETSDWSRTWGETYVGHELTDSIYVLPEGVVAPEKRYKTIILIDQYDSFGDGHHPTTRLCGELLNNLIENIITGKADRFSMLDIGTGSGILAIAAWRMGVRDIELFDHDPVAVEKAVKNLSLNGICSLYPHVADIYSFNTEKKYDIITSNLLSRILEDNILKIKSFIRPGGFLIVSGIGSIWQNDMITLFSEKCLKIIEHRTIEDWNGFLLTPAI